MTHPLRSALYMPCSNLRALEKARELTADALIFDLEDAVAPDTKATARAQLCAALDQGGYQGRLVIIRINALDSIWGADDLKAVLRFTPDAILLPKVESVDHIRNAAHIMDEMGAAESIRLWAMMETPRGILRAPDIAAAHPRLSCFVMGTSDLVKDLHAAHTPQRLPVLVALGQCLLAARAEGLSILDGVHLDLNDTAGLHEACIQGRELGFDGKTLIHPKQIATANTVYAPDDEEIAHAKRLISAFDEAMAQGRAVAVLDGKLVESLHVTDARRLVGLAHAIEHLN